MKCQTIFVDCMMPKDNLSSRKRVDSTCVILPGCYLINISVHIQGYSAQVKTLLEVSLPSRRRLCQKAHVAILKSEEAGVLLAARTEGRGVRNRFYASRMPISTPSSAAVKL